MQNRPIHNQQDILFALTECFLLSKSLAPASQTQIAVFSLLTGTPLPDLFFMVTKTPKPASNSSNKNTAPKIKQRI